MAPGLSSEVALALDDPDTDLDAESMIRALEQLDTLDGRLTETLDSLTGSFEKRRAARASNEGSFGKSTSREGSFGNAGGSFGAALSSFGSIGGWLKGERTSDALSFDEKKSYDQTTDVSLATTKSDSPSEAAGSSFRRSPSGGVWNEEGERVYHLTDWSVLSRISDEDATATKQPSGGVRRILDDVMLEDAKGEDASKTSESSPPDLSDTSLAMPPAAPPARGRALIRSIMASDASGGAGVVTPPWEMRAGATSTSPDDKREVRREERKASGDMMNARFRSWNSNENVWQFMRVPRRRQCRAG